MNKSGNLLFSLTNKNCHTAVKIKEVVSKVRFYLVEILKKKQTNIHKINIHSLGYKSKNINYFLITDDCSI